MTFNFNPTGIEVQLRRIADALDRAVPFIPPERLAILKKRGPEAIVRYGEDKKQWMKEQYGTTLHEAGLAPSEEASLLNDMMEEVGEMDEDELREL